MRPVALVTGASGGIGRAVAVALAGRGYDLVIHYGRSAEAAQATAAQVRSLGAEACLAAADLGSQAACLQLLEAAPRLDVLVNNAGTTEVATMDGLTEEAWDRIFAVNLKAPFFLARAAAGRLREARGAIVNVSSTAAFNAVGSSPAYCASKAALNNLTMALARELAPEVRVNAVAPGMVDTPWLERGFGDRERLRQRVQSQTPLGRVCQPEDVAAAVLALVADMSFVTGQVLVVNGGMR